MKSFIAFLVAIGKFYIGLKVIWWICQEFYEPQLHDVKEIEVYLILIIFDIWIGTQSQLIEKYSEKKED